MKYSITHTTKYIYDDYVSYCHNIATLKPRETPGQQLLDFSLHINPQPTEIIDIKDFFGNSQTKFSILEQHRILNVTSQSLITRDFAPILNAYTSDACRNVTLQNALTNIFNLDDVALDARQYILESPLIRKVSQEIIDYALVSFKDNRSVFDAGYELMQRIFSDFNFVPGFTNVATPINVVISEKKGVCQDFAQIAIACIRSVGLPARYVSGYIETIPPADVEKLIGSDASHAWFSMYIPGFGWVDFDPTNNKLAADQHIVVAWGRDYFDVAPLKGVIYSNGENKMSVSVDVKKVW